MGYHVIPLVEYILFFVTELLSEGIILYLGLNLTKMLLNIPFSFSDPFEEFMIPYF